MSLQRVLRDIMLFNEGNAYIGEIVSCTPPKLGRKMEGHRAGGMDSEVKLDMGGDYGDFEFECAAPMRDIIRQHGIVQLDGVGLRFREASQNSLTGGVDVIDYSVRGRHEEIDRGEKKLGEKGAFKVKTAWVYYKEEWNGVTEVEIDKINGTLIVGGVDRSAELRQAMGY